MPRPPTVRPLRPSDRDELWRMRAGLWPDSTEDEVDGLLAQPLPAPIFVGDRGDGRLGGFAEIGLRPFAEGCATSPVAYLEGIWTDPDLRRTGLAKRLVEAAEAWARDRGLQELASDAAQDDEISRSFHRAAGFEEVGRVVCFRRPL